MGETPSFLTDYDIVVDNSCEFDNKMLKYSVFLGGYLMMDKAKALEIWDQELGEKEYVYDFAGRKIKREDYLETNQVGWVVAYMRPLQLGGTQDSGNIVVVHHRTAEDKGDRYPEFETDGQQYIIQYEENGDYYYIEKCIPEEDEDDDYYETDDE
jgi:hypothetical protein